MELKRQRIHPVWKVFLILSLSSCGTANTKVPVWPGKLFIGDSKQSALVRSQSGTVIQANDPAFDDYIAMSSEDFKLFYKTYVLGCQSWYPGTKMTKAIKIFNANQPQLERFIK